MKRNVSVTAEQKVPLDSRWRASRMESFLSLGARISCVKTRGWGSPGELGGWRASYRRLAETNALEWAFVQYQEEVEQRKLVFFVFYFPQYTHPTTPTTPRIIRELRGRSSSECVASQGKRNFKTIIMMETRIRRRAETKRISHNRSYRLQGSEEKSRESHRNESSRR